MHHNINTQLEHAAGGGVCVKGSRWASAMQSSAPSFSTQCQLTCGEAGTVAPVRPLQDTKALERQLMSVILAEESNHHAK